ncbi:Phage protein [Escherichia phage rV5_ev158]|jgi:hypothetical protein|uniref:Uncharacterized protein n=1 Tax=Escherichia phage naam TaxID=2696427 RepID=A0A6B9XAC6_9CAUD|nr:hypothetical protein [Escherichia coli O157]EKH6169008.1 hypothetical protein [Escherichia coli O157]QHR73611.1 hypothetical protein naam_105 [Escherichia phage naam]VVA60559.1 Phage protein [Escherichia phage rV5_ev168]VVA60572.1 Phage protein [Escherichia phage rV5_ev158]
MVTLERRKAIAATLADIFWECNLKDTRYCGASVDALFPRPTIVAMGNLSNVVYGAWDKEGGFYIWQPDYGTWKEVRGADDFGPAVAKTMDGWQIYVGNDMKLKGEIVYWLP